MLVPNSIGKANAERVETMREDCREEPVRSALNAPHGRSPLSGQVSLGSNGRRAMFRHKGKARQPRQLGRVEPLERLQDGDPSALKREPLRSVALGLGKLGPDARGKFPNDR